MYIRGMRSNFCTAAVPTPSTALPLSPFISSSFSSSSETSTEIVEAEGTAETAEITKDTSATETTKTAGTAEATENIQTGPNVNHNTADDGDTSIAMDQSTHSVTDNTKITDHTDNTLYNVYSSLKNDSLTSNPT